MSMRLMMPLGGAKTVKNGSAQTRCAQGMSTSSIRERQRNPLVLTKWLSQGRLDRGRCLAVIAPHRREGSVINPSLTLHLVQRHPEAAGIKADSHDDLTIQHD